MSNRADLTMTVGELIELLRQAAPNRVVVLAGQNGGSGPGGGNGPNGLRSLIAELLGKQTAMPARGGKGGHCICPMCRADRRIDP